MSRRHLVHIIDLSSGGEASMKSRTVPGGDPSFDKTAAAFKGIIAFAEYLINVGITVPAQGFGRGRRDRAGYRFGLTVPLDGGATAGDQGDDPHVRDQRVWKESTRAAYVCVHNRRSTLPGNGRGSPERVDRPPLRTGGYGYSG